MKVSSQVASELVSDQDASTIDDASILNDLEALICGDELSVAARETVKNAIGLIKAHDALLLEIEERKTEAIRGFHGSNEVISDLEEIIGGDYDLATGFACLRTESGDSPGEILIFLKGDFLGQVQARGPGEFVALVKRNGQITEKKYDKKGKAIVSVIMQAADRIAMELSKGREKKSDNDLMSMLEGK